LIELNDIKGYSTINRLKDYKGKNPYILKLKHSLLKNGKINLSETQVKYIDVNFDREPDLINKVIEITDFLAESLKKDNNLSILPKKILIEYILAETDKVFHIYGKLVRNQKYSKTYFIPKTQLLDDPYFTIPEIDVDFEKYEKIDSFVNMDGTVGRKIFDLQKEGVKFLLTRNGAILADGMGSGKAEFVENRVFTPKGRKKIGELKPGDYVIGSDGKPTLVKNVYPQGIKPLYRITFNDKTSVLCCKEHLWEVSNNKKQKFILNVEQMVSDDTILEHYGSGHNKNKKYNIKTNYKCSNGNNKWQIPIVKPIEFYNDIKLPIEPYLLGLILGDGYIRKKYVRFSIHKDDFYEMFLNYNVKELKDNRNLKVCSIKFDNELIDLKLNNTKSDTKFIPNIYKYTSIENRLAILQGLMDTDGHCCLSNNSKGFKGTEYATASKQLCDDLVEIVHSLGGIARVATKVGKYKDKNNNVINCKLSYRVNVKLPNEFNPFRLSRKSNAYIKPEKYKVGRYIKDIKFEKKGEAVCIEVDALDHLYVTENAIVTHNTVQSIIAALESGSKKILVVCPSSVKLNWEREFRYMGETDITIINGSRWKDAKITIINYDILKNFHTLKKDIKTSEFVSRELVNANFDLVIADEAHNLKNYKSNRGAIMKELCTTYGVDKVWLLTGTPIANRPMDFYNLLTLIKSPITNNWKFYVTRYCDGKQINRRIKGSKTPKKIWITDGSSNLEELNRKTRNVLLRRLTHEFTDMPDKTVIPMYFDLNSKQQADYDALWEDYMIERQRKELEGEVKRQLVELGLLRKYIAMITIEKTIQIVEEMIENDEKVVIFTCFTEELKELQEHFGKKCVVHYGEMNEKDKQKSVDKFQSDDKIKVFIGNIISAGVGITLTRANMTVFNSFDWVPGNIDQAEDRTWRIGQKNNVKIYYPLYNKTVITKMWNKIKYKRKSIDTILGDDKRDIVREVLEMED